MSTLITQPAQDAPGRRASESKGIVLSAPDQVRVTGIAGFGRHGVFASERENGQRFVVDVTCQLDLAPAGASDDLRQTIDYGALAAAVVADIEGEPLNLIEALAERIAATCLKAGPVRQVEVTVHKPQAPIAVEFTDVAVTLTRRS